MTTTTYLDRFFASVAEAFTPEMARPIVNLRVDAETEARVGDLRRKANEGNLTPAVDAEYKEFVEAVDVISIHQAKARRFLAQHSA